MYGALDAQHVFEDLDRRRPAFLAVHDTVDDGTAYRAELSALVDQPALSDDPVLQLPDSWWEDLAGTLEKVAAADTDRVAVRQQYMDRAIPEFVGIPAPAVIRWTAAHSDLHWANVTAPLRILDWEGWGASSGRVRRRHALRLHAAPGERRRPRPRRLPRPGQPGLPRRRSDRVRPTATDREPRRHLTLVEQGGPDSAVGPTFDYVHSTPSFRSASS
ncbi:hypothetical protein [Streptomyces akebiae]|uniref:Uncharacterized protein n=1 Tax=Streptomyces akebiae TaxID=2865673 RepID=A0ABX8Y5T6_9ACTN|nr:hypothetical protein [Streptomyces akebiae]QYX83546.1 hypothetical protein K1J60_44530 [Streptomyces akebiae]